MNELAEHLLNSFPDFCSRYMDEGYFDPALHTEVCAFIQKAGNRKCVILPRSYLKSTIVSKLYASWRGIRSFYFADGMTFLDPEVPDIRILVSANSGDNAAKKVRGIRQLFESKMELAQLYPEVIPPFNSVRWTDSCAELNRINQKEEGTFESAGIRSNIISRHYNLIIEDDTVAPTEDELDQEIYQPSNDDITKAINWHKLATPLLVNPSDDILCIATRWAYDDFIGYIQQKLKYPTLERAAIEKGASTYSRFSLEDLENIKNDLGPYFFSALYMNSPVKPENMDFKPEWFKDFDYDVSGVEGLRQVTVDPAIGKKDTNDYTALAGCLHIPGKTYVLATNKGRYSPQRTVNRAIDMALSIKARRIKVETIAYQEALVYAFSDELKRRGLYMSIEPFRSKRAKDERIRGLQPFFANGAILTRSSQKDLKNELMTFPYGKWDDLADALSMHLPEMKHSPRPEIKREEKQIVRGTPLDDILKELHDRFYQPAGVYL